jgi:thiamine-monophosphate kinase
LVVNPVFSTLKVRLCKPVPCPEVQGVDPGAQSASSLGVGGKNHYSMRRQTVARLPIGVFPQFMPLKPQNENAILSRISARFRSSPSRPAAPSVALAIGDDAALFRPKPGFETILTCDWFLEGTHFLRAKHPPDAVGWKCLARALSDIAAMGGTPRCFLLSLALPETHGGEWLAFFLCGLRRASQKFGCVLAGGDTTCQDRILINVTVVGEVRAGQAIRRSGARPGDILHVSGRLGEAELGLELIRRSKRAADRTVTRARKHLYPEPRLALGRWLREKGYATSMMDLSDGLSSDLPRLCRASSVGAEVEIGRVPKVRVPSLLLRQGVRALQLALHGGDDYELLFTVPPDKEKLLPDRFQGLALTSIGRITREPDLLVFDEHGEARDFAAGGWDPFGKKL